MANQIVPAKMKFCCNISFMFTEVPFVDRYLKARENGFIAVESGYPFGLDIKAVLKAKSAAKIEQVMINIFTGDVTKGELGLAAVPHKEKEFLDALTLTIKACKMLGCKKIHIMAGKRIPGCSFKEQFDAFVANLKLAKSKLEDEDMIGLIEPINKMTVPDYFLDDYKAAREAIRQVRSKNIRLMVDVFHLQKIAGNLYQNLHDLAPVIGHVQIAQVPTRHEPNTAGEIQYPYVLKQLKEIGYEGWVGLEYTPKNDTARGLSWIKEFGYQL